MCIRDRYMGMQLDAFDRQKAYQVEELRSQLESSVKARFESEYKNNLSLITTERSVLQNQVSNLQKQLSENQYRLILLSCEIERLHKRLEEFEKGKANNSNMTFSFDSPLKTQQYNTHLGSEYEPKSNYTSQQLQISQTSPCLLYTSPSPRDS
eukprot:TRINITY_DN3458_c0_g1_i3.p1 TRINITY_DN3458_c0_g1~~TRINITY_DN3458_c0_g1_i3.p1  ORF type:complete len:153 (-),score=20.89 TRINITY_DN3458_c0_g1_i3:28-486(-)